MAYKVQITKKTSNPGPLAISESFVGTCSSLPVVNQAFHVYGDKSMFHTSKVMEIRYKGTKTTLVTMNSMYDLEILEIND